MKDEIKEILEKSLDYEFNLTFKQRKELLDYITNLQEGNHNLLQEIEDIQNKNNKLIEENKELYESIEKAICYLANCDWNNKEFYDLYEILIGEDKDANRNI